MAISVQTRKQPDSEQLEAFIRSQVQSQVDEALKEFRRQPKFSADDMAFLIWTLGFTAGAHLERDGERGERIFGRCRQLIEQLQPMGGNGS